MGVLLLSDRERPSLATLFPALPAIGSVLPLYRPEYVMGVTLALTYTFGPVIPLVIASILSDVSAGAGLLVQPLYGPSSDASRVRATTDTTPIQYTS